MFAKLTCFVAALALAPWARALLLQIPVGWQSSSDVNVTWTHTSSDIPFTLQLVNTNQFHDTFSIADNLQPGADFAKFQLGVVPAGEYTLRAIAQGNATNVLDQTPSFTIEGPPPESSTTSSSAATSRSTGASTPASSSTLTVSGTAPASGATSTSGFGQTVAPSSTSGASGTAAGASNTASSTSTDGAVPSNFNGGGNGAASLPRIAPWALAALGVVAGAAVAL